MPWVGKCLRRAAARRLYAVRNPEKLSRMEQETTLGRLLFGQEVDRPWLW